jgi:diacylglycerol kinase family enzyme
VPPGSPRVHAIINLRSGTPDKAAAARRVEEFFASRNASARVDLVRHPRDLPEAIARATTGDAEIVVAGGGDGTIAAVASAVVDSEKQLGVLPLGTFNYFAQRIGVPLDLDGALDVIGTAAATKVLSVGEVNGRIFLNNSSIGLYPAMLKQRETTYDRVGRSQAVAYMSVALVLLQPPGLMNLEMTADGEKLQRRTPLLFIGANPDQMATFGIDAHQCLDNGRLALYITKPLSIGPLWRLAVRGLVSGLRGAEELEMRCAQSLDVTVRRKRVRVALDGEVARLHSPLRYRLRRDALRVVVPAG